MKFIRSTALALFAGFAFWGLVAAVVAWSLYTWGEEALGFAFLAILLGCVIWGLVRIVLSARRHEKWSSGIYVSAMVACFCLGAGPLLVFKNTIPDEFLGGYAFGLGFLLMLLSAIAFWAVGRALAYPDDDDQ